jgi:hypothetical protein
MSRIPAYFTLGALYQQMAKTAREYNMRRTSISDTSYSSDSTSETSYRLKEPIIVANPHLIDLCTRNEWYLIGQIMRDMYQYNALWLADKEKKAHNAAYKIGLKGLLDKKIIFQTETMHMYIVNPVHLRRGDPFAVTAATANMLMNRKPTLDMLEDKRPVTTFNFAQLEN